MMRRSCRVFWAVLAPLAFSVTLESVAPLAARVCAMHGAPTTQLANADAVDHATIAHDAPGHDAHSQDAPGHDATAIDASVPTDAPDHNPAHPCDCESDCCGVRTVALTMTTAVSIEALARPLDEVARNNPAPARTAPRERLLPFANGPPPRLLG
jgi:hypothetical protein